MLLQKARLFSSQAFGDGGVAPYAFGNGCEIPGVPAAVVVVAPSLARFERGEAVAADADGAARGGARGGRATATRSTARTTRPLQSHSSSAGRSVSRNRVHIKEKAKERERAERPRRNPLRTKSPKTNSKLNQNWQTLNHSTKAPSNGHTRTYKLSQIHILTAHQHAMPHSLNDFAALKMPRNARERNQCCVNPLPCLYCSFVRTKALNKERQQPDSSTALKTSTSEERLRKERSPGR